MAVHASGLYYDPNMDYQSAPEPVRSRFGLRTVVVGALALVAFGARMTALLCPDPMVAYTVPAVPTVVPALSVVGGRIVNPIPGQLLNNKAAVRADGSRMALANAPTAVMMPARNMEGLQVAQRYIASNQFKVRDGNGPKFEARWAARKSRLALLRGFRFFTLLRRVNPSNVQYSDDFNYVSLTVWQDKDAFNAWRTGDAFKEAHGGTDIVSFIKMIGTSLLQTKGPPKPAFYEGILPIAAPAAPTPTNDGWRTVAANGVDPLKSECFVAMQRFTVVSGKEVVFEQLWAQRSSSLLDKAGFRGFWVARADTILDDGANYVAMTVWADEKAFFAWRDVHDLRGKAGPQPGEKVPEFLAQWPTSAFYEGVLMLESAAGI